MTFELTYIPEDKIYIIYDVRVDKHGYPSFLIRLDGQWVYKKAKHFKKPWEF